MSLTLVNAVSRLRGIMDFSYFIKFQGKRILGKGELIVEYIFDKDAIIEKAPFKMQQYFSHIIRNY